MSVKFYLVGGAVRDELLGVPSKDRDFAVEAESWNEMLFALVERGVHIWQAREQYFAVRGKDPVHGDADFVLCRKDGFYSDSRRPDSVGVGSILDDLSRRDFTVNAIAKDAETGELLDPFDGQKDLQHMVLRVVGSPVERFSEDPLRLLRAVRFHIVRGFMLSDGVEESLQDEALIAQLSSVSVERVFEELRKCFAHDPWGTLTFFDRHPQLKWKVFSEMKLGLAPVIL